MAEWLRRLTRNQMGSSCASSNFAHCETFRSSVLNTSNHQKVRNNAKKGYFLEKEEKMKGQFKKQ